MSSKVEDYTKNVLKVVVAQVCQIIGWNSIHQSSLEVLVDTLDRFMQELTKQTYRITELCKLLDFPPLCVNCCCNLPDQFILLIS